jgi:hypothetical protein
MACLFADQGYSSADDLARARVRLKRVRLDLALAAAWREINVASRLAGRGLSEQARYHRERALRTLHRAGVARTVQL